eukprot:CAMPEP_0171256632 /NCGR_PEP_ID=MMETSP0790-20130122/53413_1 /TAXON_ID=2925 /ORGANISM="Alexandrium catenella, Strain OF101" /LENGTH=35 /DNA_ID= /DNA_START= /DNA_END= /DNA_ORIENTATION=
MPGDCVLTHCEEPGDSPSALRAERERAREAAARAK